VAEHVLGKNGVVGSIPTVGSVKSQAPFNKKPGISLPIDRCLSYPFYGVALGLALGLSLGLAVGLAVGVTDGDGLGVVPPPTNVLNKLTI
jgi:hypothetical protein